MLPSYFFFWSVLVVGQHSGAVVSAVASGHPTQALGLDDVCLLAAYLCNLSEH